LLVHQTLRLDVVARRTALDEIAGDGEGCAGEPDQRDRQFSTEDPDGFLHPRDVLIWLKLAESIEIGPAAERFIDDGTHPGLNLDTEADGSDWNHDVRIQDRGVHAIATDWLESYLRRQFRVPECLEDAAGDAQISILRKGPASLAHEPDRGVIHRESPARSEEGGFGSLLTKCH